jgi:type IX secretion system substrate protein
LGSSNSGLNGDVSQPNWGPYWSEDYWIVKIDSLGNKQWDKRFGGTLQDVPSGTIFQTSDGGFLLGGGSDSPISGDKTEANSGFAQSWVVKIDSSGNKQWDKTVLTNGTDWVTQAIQSGERCYAIANYTSSGIGGYQTQPNWDTTNVHFDYWIIKFCDTTLTTSIQSAIQNPQSAITISPNPATDKIYISFPATASENITIKIFSVTGEIVFEKKNIYPDLIGKSTAPITKFQIPVFNISNGIYFLSVQTEKEKITKKIVVNH